ncbi:MAG: hypothetical protein AABX05_01320, partial [Nanoarchaeota archaeon]
MNPDLEDRTIEQLKEGKCSVERALLVVSELDEAGVSEYQRKLDGMQKDFERWREWQCRDTSDYRIAAALFYYLAGGYESRYIIDEFKLSKVIDNQLDGEGEVGNCLGLTSLYSVLGEKLGLNLGVLHI